MNSPRYVRSEPRAFAEIGPEHYRAYKCVIAGQDAFDYDDGLGWVAACLSEFPGARSVNITNALRPGKTDVLDDRLPDIGDRPSNGL
jgi:hypothetical protein